jgi:SAM-dependent methyltransferase
MPPYLKIYSRLAPQELRQHDFREAYRRLNPNWDDSLIILLKSFRPYARPHLKILDAGCGRGNILIDHYRKFFARAVGLDIDKERTQGNRCLDTIVFGNLEAIPFPAATFDVVVSLWVIEHLTRPTLVFTEIYRVLKPGGIFIFVTPNRCYYLFLIKALLGNRITKKLLGRLYARHQPDVFPTFYRANTAGTLNRQLGSVGLIRQSLIVNNDPTYLAFNTLTFRAAVFLEKILNLFPVDIARAHLIGVYQKPNRVTIPLDE